MAYGQSQGPNTLCRLVSLLFRNARTSNVTRPLYRSYIYAPLHITVLHSSRLYFLFRVAPLSLIRPMNLPYLQNRTDFPTVNSSLTLRHSSFGTFVDPSVVGPSPLPSTFPGLHPPKDTRIPPSNHPDRCTRHRTNDPEISTTIPKPNLLLCP